MTFESQEEIPSQKVITIKHGSAPEIQEVNISVVKRHSDASRLSGDVLYQMTDSELEQPFHRRRPLSKTMTTTKSTMTNEEDYQIDVTKLHDEESSSSESLADGGHLAADMNEDIRITTVKEAQKQKVLAWKMTPKVHFPIRQDSPLISPVPQEMMPQLHKSIPLYINQTDWNYLQDPVIDPPFEHRPDKSYVIHQNQPIPLNPLKVWPGYGGNLYFEPVRVESKPLYARDGNETQAGSRARSRTNSRFTFDRTATTLDGLSDSKYMSLPPSSPYRSENHRDDYSPDPAAPHKTPMDEFRRCQPGDLLFQRQMAHLDKNYVLNMKGNSKLHEDWSWIAGMESIGTLCIGDTGNSVKKQLSKPYSRTLVAEKVPRNFIFHPGNNPQHDEFNSQPRQIPLVQVTIDTKKRKTYPPDEYAYWKERSIENWSGRTKKTSRKQQTHKQQLELSRRLRLPSIPIRVKGHNVNTTSCYNPWELFKIGSSKPLHSNNGDRTANSSKTKSRARQVISQNKSSFASPDDKENLAFSITNLLGASEKRTVPQRDTKKPVMLVMQTADTDTDDEEKLNYETIRSVFYSSRAPRITGDGRKVPNSTPC